MKPDETARHFTTLAILGSIALTQTFIAEALATGVPYAEDTPYPRGYCNSNVNGGDPGDTLNYECPEPADGPHEDTTSVTCCQHAHQGPGDFSCTTVHVHVTCHQPGTDSYNVDIKCEGDGSECEDL